MKRRLIFFLSIVITLNIAAPAIARNTKRAPHKFSYSHATIKNINIARSGTAVAIGNISGGTIINGPGTVNNTGQAVAKSGDSIAIQNVDNTVPPGSTIINVNIQVSGDKLEIGNGFAQAETGTVEAVQN